MHSVSIQQQGAYVSRKCLAQLRVCGCGNPSVARCWVRYRARPTPSSNLLLTSSVVVSVAIVTRGRENDHVFVHGFSPEQTRGYITLADECGDHISHDAVPDSHMH